MPHLLFISYSNTFTFIHTCRFYKTNSIDFSRLQVCVDTFLFSGQYTDLATVAVLSKYTGGSTYYYPGFVSARDGEWQ